MELFAITDSEIPTRIIKIDIDAPAQTVVKIYLELRGVSL